MFDEKTVLVKTDRVIVQLEDTAVLSVALSPESDLLPLADVACEEDDYTFLFELAFRCLEHEASAVTGANARAQVGYLLERLEAIQEISLYLL